MDIERIAQVLALQRQGPTLARIGDSVQQSFVLILSHLTQYDPSRAGFSTWVYDWAREAVEQETKRGRFGYGFEAGNGRTASRLIEHLEAIENPEERPLTVDEFTRFASRVLRKKISGQTAQALLRYALRFEHLGAVSSGEMEKAVPLGVLEDEQIDAHAMAVLGDLTVRDALTSVTPIERDRIGSYVGLDGPAETQRSIAKSRSVGAGVVNRRVRRGTERIKNTAALGALDQDAVDYRDPSS